MPRNRILPEAVRPAGSVPITAWATSDLPEPVSPSRVSGRPGATVSDTPDTIGPSAEAT